MDNLCKNGKTPGESAVQMEQLVLPNDANRLNNLFGGRLLQWIDSAGAMSAMKHSRKEVATVAVDSVDFREPVRVGDIVRLSAKVTWTGTTSMEVKVTVLCEKPRTGEAVKTNEARLTLVALDDSGKPSPVPPLLPVTEEEKRNFAAAEEKRRHRAVKKTEK